MMQVVLHFCIEPPHVDAIHECMMSLHTQRHLGLHATGATIVVVTHNREIAESFPRVVGLRDGQIEYDTAGQEVV